MLTRYRNATALATVIVIQIILLGVQVRRDDGMTMLRAWTVGAVSPVTKTLHGGFSFVSGLWGRYVWLMGAQQENERLERELTEARMEATRLERELERFTRLEKLVDYRKTIPSETLVAEVIGGGAKVHSREIILDRGREADVLPGMAVITADGVVGRVEASYRGSAFVELISDPDAAVGVILGRSRVRGVLKGRGGRECFLDHVLAEVDVRIGEIVYTSGEDRIYPKGFPVGEVARTEDGGDLQGIYVTPFAALDRLDEVLVVRAGVHQELPERPLPQPSELLLQPPGEISQGPRAPEETGDVAASTSRTDADRLLERYRGIVAARGVPLGENRLGVPPPDFNADPNAPGAEDLAETPAEPEPAAPEPEPNQR